MLSSRTMSEPELEECPFCATTIRPGAIVCAACGAFKDKRMGCTGCLALVGAVAFTLGVLGVAAMFPHYGDEGGIATFVFAGLVYAVLAALCYWALGKRCLGVFWGFP